MWHPTALVLSVALVLSSVQVGQGLPTDPSQRQFPRPPARKPYDYCQAGYFDPDNYSIPEAKGAVLAHVQTFIRHGDRSPVHILPQDTNVSWDCSDINTFAFSGLRDDKGSPLQQGGVVANHVAIIPESSPWVQDMWKGSCFPGQLTSVGARQHQRLGQVLKEVYINRLSLLDKKPDPATVYFRSSDTPRTKQSAENLLRGLFSASSDANITTSGNVTNSSNSTESEVDISVIDVYFPPKDIDTMFKNNDACPAIRRLEKKIYGSSKVLKKLTKDNIEFKKDLVRIFGADPEDSDWNPTRMDWTAYMDVVHTRQCHDLPLQCEPANVGNDEEGEEDEDGGDNEEEREEGDGGDNDTLADKPDNKEKCITREMIERIEDNAEIYIAETRRDAKNIDTLMRLTAGPLVNDMRRDLADARNKGSIRFTLFSGHDDTIASVLGVLKSRDIRWPPYASNVLFELWRVQCKYTDKGCNDTNGDEYFVRAFYNGAVVEANWCDLSWCPYDTFMAHLDSFVPDDIMRECYAKVKV